MFHSFKIETSDHLKWKRLSMSIKNIESILYLKLKKKNTRTVVKVSNIPLSPFVILILIRFLFENPFIIPMFYQL